MEGHTHVRDPGIVAGEQRELFRKTLRMDLDPLITGLEKIVIVYGVVYRRTSS